MDNDIEPEVPVCAAPVPRTIAPLEPSEPALEVSTVRLPLCEESPWPETRITEPPVAVVLEPAFNEIEPPTFSEVPTLMAMLPAVDELAPVFKDICPLEVEADPDCILIDPEETPALLSIVTPPLAAATLDPDVTIKEPPVEDVLEPACIFNEPPTVFSLAPTAISIEPPRPSLASPVNISIFPTSPSVLDPVFKETAPLLVESIPAAVCNNSPPLTVVLDPV